MIEEPCDVRMTLGRERRREKFKLRCFRVKKRWGEGNVTIKPQREREREREKFSRKDRISCEERDVSRGYVGVKELEKCKKRPCEIESAKTNQEKKTDIP